MKRREAILSTIAALTGATTRAEAPAMPSPQLPPIPIVADAELAERLRFHYDWDMQSLAGAVESAIQTFRLCPGWIMADELPEQLRDAIFDDTGREPFSEPLGNLAPLLPGYPSKLIEKAKASLERDRTEEKQRAEAEALAAAKEAEREADDADEQAKEERLIAAKIVSQSALEKIFNLRALLNGCIGSLHAPLRERLAEGWTIEPGPLSVGPAPDFEITVVEEECA